MLKKNSFRTYYYECTINQIEIYSENSRNKRTILVNSAEIVFFNGGGRENEFAFQLGFPDLANTITGCSVRYEFQVKNKNISL